MEDFNLAIQLLRTSIIIITTIINTSIITIAGYFMLAMECKYSVSGPTDDASTYQRSPSKTDEESMTQATKLEEHLRPSQFDWADESEELEGTEEMEGQSEGSVGEGELEETMASFYDLERQPSNSSGEPVNEEDEWSNFDDAMVPEATMPEPDYRELKRASMQEDINQEFAFRQGWMEVAGESVHHFNWLGSPRYRYSTTPATISLLFLVTTPKIPSAGDEWRLDAIMRRAMHHVDPVMVVMENGCEDFKRKGSDLVRWATGRAYKFYSPHGNWRRDPQERDDSTELDIGDIDHYTENTLAFGNGFVRDYTIRSRAQWGDEHQRLYAEKSPAPSQTRLPKTPHKPSGLRHCVLPGDLEDLDGAEPSMAPRIQRPASRIPRMRRAFSQSTSDLLTGLQRESSVHGFDSGLDAMIEDGSKGSEYTDNSEYTDDSEDTDGNYDSDDSDDEHLDIGEIVQLSYEEFKEAERRRTDIIETAALEPTLETIHEEDESVPDSEEDEKVNTVDNVEQVQDDQADQMVEQEQDDQNTDIVEQSRHTNYLVIEQAKNGQNDQNDQGQDSLQSSHLGEHDQKDQEDVTIETVKQDKNDQNYNGHIDQFESIDPTDQHQRSHQRISPDTHATSGSDTIYYISNEPHNEDANVQTVDSEPPNPATDQKNKKWKKRISRISQKARNALRSKRAQSPESNSSGSFESTPSHTSNCDPDRQHISLFHTEIPQDGDEKPHKTSSTKKLATKVKRVLSRSSTEKDTATPKKQRRIFFSDLFYEGIWAFESYSVVVA